MNFKINSHYSPTQHSRNFLYNGSSRFFSAVQNDFFNIQRKLVLVFEEKVTCQHNVCKVRLHTEVAKSV